MATSTEANSLIPPQSFESGKFKTDVTPNSDGTLTITETRRSGRKVGQVRERVINAEDGISELERIKDRIISPTVVGTGYAATLAGMGKGFLWVSPYMTPGPYVPFEQFPPSYVAEVGTLCIGFAAVIAVVGVSLSLSGATEYLEARRDIKTLRRVLGPQKSA